MGPELEHEVTRALHGVARATEVPGVPDLPRTSDGRRRRRWVVVLAAAAVAAAVLVPAVVGDDADRPVERPAPPFAGLPTGPPPTVAYVAGGTSVVRGDHAIELEEDVEAIDGSLVWDADTGAIHRVSADGVVLVAADASGPPVTDGEITWLEDGDVVRGSGRRQERQRLPAGCCDDARLVGVDADMDPDVLVAGADGAWLWDTYEGREGRAEEQQPPDSEDWAWPVGGLRGGTIVGTGIGSEVLVEHPGGRWGWGYVGGPRDPGSDAPVRYREQERVAAERVWLTLPAVVAVEPGGRLVALGTRLRYDGVGHVWRALTGESAALGLTSGLRVHGVVGEERTTVLVDVTDEDGRRAWVRCHVRTLGCEVAAGLAPDDVVPTR